MAPIAYAIMFDDYTVGAMRPFKAGDIGLLENHRGCRTAFILCKPEIQKNLHCCHAQIRVAIVRREVIGLPVNFQERNGSRWIAATRNAVESPLDRSERSDLIAECAGDPVGHAAPLRIAGDINAVRIYAVIVLEITDEVAGELYVVCSTRWPKCPDAGIPGRWAIDGLRENEDEARPVRFGTHIGVLSGALRGIVVAMIVNYYWLRLIPI